MMLNILYLPETYKLLMYNEYVSRENKIIDGRINLIYGVENAKKQGLDIDYNDNKISPELYWTFSIEESSTKHYHFFNEFIFNLPDNFIQLYKIIHVPLSDNDWLLGIPFEKIFINKKFIFFGLFNKKIYIANLLEWHYFGFDTKTLINTIKKERILTHDKDGAIVSEYFRKLDSTFTEKIITVLL